MNVQFQPEQLQHLDREPELQSRLAPFELRQKPYPDPRHASGISQRQSRCFAPPPNQLPKLLRIRDVGHLAYLTSIPVREISLPFTGEAAKLSRSGILSHEAKKVKQLFPIGNRNVNR